MQEFKVETEGFEELAERLSKSPEVFRRARAAAINRAAPKLKVLIDSEIGGTGRLKSFQESRVGSLGGYAAVSARAKTFAESRGMQTFSSGEGSPPRYAVGYITNAVNNGHRPRERKTFAQERGYYTLGKWVAGKFFYQRAKDKAPVIAQQAAAEVLDDLTEFLEG